jgi:hypothetical protein
VKPEKHTLSTRSAILVTTAAAEASSLCLFVDTFLFAFVTGEGVFWNFNGVLSLRNFGN